MTRPKTRRATRRIVCLVCAATASSAFAEARGSVQETSDAHAPPSTSSFVLPDGFHADLYAGDGLVPDAGEMRWDARGRAWVASGDRLLILVDTDRDLRADAVSAFADELGGDVTSFAFTRAPLPDADAGSPATQESASTERRARSRTSVVVAVGNRIVALADADGDDRAELRETLFEGVDGELSSMTYGLDGWIHAVLRSDAPGRERLVANADAELVSVADGVVRFTADGRTIETTVALEGARSLARRWDGEWFLATDATHLAHVVLPDRAFAGGRLHDVTSWIDAADHSFVVRVPRKGEATPLTGGFGTPAGSCFYDEPRWPEAYHGNRFVCEPEGGVVHRDVISPWGVTFQGKRAAKAEFLSSRDPSFRPVGVEVGPDGALYVVDRPRSTAGASARIWRIQHEGVHAPVVAPPVLAELSANELVRELGSPSRWRRDVAQRLLVPSRDARDRLVEAAEVSTDPFTKLHAVWLLPDSADVVRTALRDFHENIRSNALRAVASLDQVDGVVASGTVRTFAGDGTARTRLAALVAWARVNDGPGQRELVDLYPTLEDDWSRSAALAAAARTPVTFQAAMLRWGAAEDFVEFFEALTADVGRRASLRDAVAMVLRLREDRADPRLVATALRAFYAHLDAEQTPWPSPRLELSMRGLAEHEDLRIAAAAVPLVVRWLGDQLATTEVRGWLDRVERAATDASLAPPLRVGALRTAFSFEERRDAARASATEWLGGGWSTAADEDRASALAALDARGSAVLLDPASTKLTPPVRSLVLDALVAIEVWGTGLVEALAVSAVSPEELGGARGATLCAHPNPKVAQRARALLAP